MTDNKPSPPNALSRDILISRALVEVHGILLAIAGKLDGEQRATLTPMLESSSKAIASLVEALQKNVDAKANAIGES